jgi:hypothetical protein
VLELSAQDLAIAVADYDSEDERTGSDSEDGYRRDEMNAKPAVGNELTHPRKGR